MSLDCHARLPKRVPSAPRHLVQRQTTENPPHAAPESEGHHARLPQGVPSALCRPLQGKSTKALRPGLGRHARLHSEVLPFMPCHPLQGRCTKVSPAIAAHLWHAHPPHPGKGSRWTAVPQWPESSSLCSPSLPAAMSPANVSSQRRLAPM